MGLAARRVLHVAKLAGVGLAAAAGVLAMAVMLIIAIAPGR